ncbi:TonB-dependent receptor [Pedobacter heparinus]|uniref:SusC/RagA family TonB-linked outer membrane protein n=1 Tax=Pedobacter heparinus TaxID=984 RepID=UPI00292D2DF0|nr:TonB-dependent receptor [Pedobacter heparinus]
MKRILLLILLLSSWTFIYAQETITVTGIVRDGENLPMPGATVTEKGTNNRVITANNGKYQIKVKSSSTLVFTYLGTKPVEQPVNKRTSIDVKLLDDNNNLNEVVVTGYGQAVQRKDLTGAISSVKGEELAKVPVQNVAQALQGRLAGVQVAMPDGTPGSTPSIVIRGGSSITQSNEPLYVVDGVPQTDGLSFLDPMDIESVDVLKDASATAIYGARGANGVILVTTKQIKEGKVKINYDGYVGAKNITNTIDVLDPYQYALLQYEKALPNAPRLAAFLKNYGSYDSLQIRYGNRPGINWQDEVFGQTAMSQYHKISVNGGGKETKFNMFYSLNNDEGIMLKSGSTKNIFKLTVNHNVSQKFSINGIVNYSHQKITGLGTQEGGNARLSMLQTLLQYRPINGIGNIDDALIDQEVDPLDPNPNSPAFQSPLVSINTRPRENLVKTLNASVSAQYTLNKYFTYRGLASYTDKSDKLKQFNEASSITSIRSGGPFGSVSHNVATRFNYNNSLTYANVFKKDHKLDVSVGQEYIYNYSEGLGAAAAAFPGVNLGWDRLQLGSVPGFPTSFAEDDKLLSFFGRANYSYKGKYLFSATLRADGSSKFGSENLWGIFPSAAFAWRIVEEEFMKQLPVVSDLKLRLSYGQAGNNRIANYAALGIFTTADYPLNNQLVVAAYQDNLPNAALKWEAVKSTNIGLDVGLFKQRLSLTAEYYDNRSQDLLFYTRIPASSGFTRQFQNIGTTSSRGIEFTLNTTNVRSQDFTWSTNFNIAFGKTEVLSLSDGENSLLTNSYTDKNDYILQVGRPVGIMYGLQQEGLYQVDDFTYNATTATYTLKPGVVRDGITVQPGYIKFKDISGPNGLPDGFINDFDRTEVGNANPKFAGGINNTFSYKGIDLSVFLNFTSGNDIYNANRLNNSRLDLDYQNTLSYFQNRWTTINSAGQAIVNPIELAALNEGKTIPSYIGAQGQRLYDKMIEDGSFLRISNVSIGYTLPKKWLNAVKVANARVYVTGYNLYVFSKYSGYDPEVSVIRNALTPGVDFSAYPRSRSFIAGINISL